MSYDAGIDQIEKNSLTLHRNENLFIDPSFLQQLAAQVTSEINFCAYPESLSEKLRIAISEYHHCSPDEVYVGNGADGVLADLLSFLREKYDEVGLQQVTYRVYPYLCKRYGYKQKHLSETSQFWMIDSPNSITGEVFDFTSANPELLIWDNVYGEYVIEEPSKIRKLDHPNLVKIHSFSKFFGLASLRVGYCLGNRELISNLLKRKDVFNVNSFAQNMAILALKNREYFSSLVLEMHAAKKALHKGLLELGFSVNRGKANFVWVTHPSICMKTLRENLNKESILVRLFDEPPLTNYIRVTVPPLPAVDYLLNILKNKVT